MLFSCTINCQDCHSWQLELMLKKMLIKLLVLLPKRLILFCSLDTPRFKSKVIYLDFKDKI